MRLNRLSVLAVASVLAVPMALGQASPAGAACPGPQPASTEEVFLASLDPPVPQEPLFLASPVNQTKKGGMRPTKVPSPLDCEWFLITCSNGTPELCCGSASSCLSYCVDFCNEPCELILN